MTKKYEFVPGDEIVIAPGRTVKRIRALVAIAALGVVPGDTGGYVEKEENLSHHGSAWVCDSAWVYGSAWVCDSAWVYGSATVYDSATVCDSARVYDSATVCDSARVYGSATVCDSAWVCGSARVKETSDWLLIGPAKSSGRFTTAFKDEKIGVRVDCGCFTGSVLEFSQQIESTHKNNPEALQQYRLFCQLIAFNFGVEP